MLTVANLYLFVLSVFIYVKRAFIITVDICEMKLYILWSVDIAISCNRNHLSGFDR